MIERTMDMVSAKDIRDVKFNKALGGYKTTEVDTFLDDCAATVEELTAVNEENNRKMQVLAETVVDYRNQEDSIRTALVSAQRMSETIINDANKEAAAILAKAQEEAAAALENANKDIAAELAELDRVKKEVATFKTRLLSTYREHLTLIGVLEGEDLPEDEEAPVEETAEAEVCDEVIPVERQPKLDLSGFELAEEE